MLGFTLAFEFRIGLGDSILVAEAASWSLTARGRRRRRRRLPGWPE